MIELFTRFAPKAPTLAEIELDPLVGVAYMRALYARGLSIGFSLGLAVGAFVLALLVLSWTKLERNRRRQAEAVHELLIQHALVLPCRALGQAADCHVCSSSDPVTAALDRSAWARQIIVGEAP